MGLGGFGEGRISGVGGWMFFRVVEGMRGGVRKRKERRSRRCGEGES